MGIFKKPKTREQVKKEIALLIQKIDELKRELDAIEVNRIKLYNAAIKALGTDASPNDVAPDELGCAETVNAIYKSVFGKEIGGTVSTSKLYEALLTSKDFVAVDNPLQGDIVISPSGYGNGNLSNGHVGIVGMGILIMSNDSFTGTFKQNYNLNSWRERYVIKGGYPMVFFRRI